MPARIRRSALKALEPYLIGEMPRDDTHEWDMYCPLHPDTKRSASLNTETAEWWCFAGCGGGTIPDLIRQRSDWVEPPDPTATYSNGNGVSRQENKELPTESVMNLWNEDLIEDRDSSLTWLIENRGLKLPIVREFKIGWNHMGKCYTIPVLSEEGELYNVRYYNPRPGASRRKIWGVTGHNEPRVYPVAVLQRPGPVFVVAGEWDALRTIQAGYTAVTRTAGEKVWKAEWNTLFIGRDVYVAQDMDAAGQAGNRIVARQLKRSAESVKVLKLPYPVVDKHGKDMTDFWNDHGDELFKELIKNAEGLRRSKGDPSDAEPVSVVDSLDAHRVGKPSKLQLTIRGKKEVGYTLPFKATLSCTQDAGTKCTVCPMNAANGEDEFKIEPNDPHILEMIESPAKQVLEVVRRAYGAMKCDRLVIDPLEHQSVEVLYGRPSIETTRDTRGDDFKTIKITSVGEYNTPANSTVEVVGALYPNPRTQSNEFLSWDLERKKTALDDFEMTSSIYKMLKRFQPGDKQTPLIKLRAIARELSTNVTKIYGRPEMHMLMDLTFHTAREFQFGKEFAEHGWLDTLVIGDTRTGKSEAARRLLHHYSAGELVGCESASIAGIVGGLQQFGSSREWAVTWGAIPQNDGRLVVLDEVSGLSVEQIGQMSDVRSRGLAQLQKVTQDMAPARTRLMWLSNPRNAKMSDFTYGVQAIAPLIGNNEDIARFDLVCAVNIHDVPSDVMNSLHADGSNRYTAEACSQLVRWAWTRTAAQIKWRPGAIEAVLKAAIETGEKYVEDPPLLQSANARLKIARTAVAFAIRCFSTDRRGELVFVGVDHVHAAVDFIDQLYGQTTLGYRDMSSDILGDRKMAESKAKEARQYMKTSKGLAKFLIGNPKFKRQDLEEILNTSKEEANLIINKLWGMRMVRKEAGYVKVEPALHTLLRELKK